MLPNAEKAAAISGFAGAASVVIDSDDESLELLNAADSPSEPPPASIR